MRSELEDHRARGTCFAHAWRQALADLEASAPPPAKVGPGREWAEWRAALGETRGAWRRSYDLEPATPGERAVCALPELLADAADVPDGRHVLMA
jgi:hypothetical protein